MYAFAPASYLTSVTAVRRRAYGTCVEDIEHVYSFQLLHHIICLPCRSETPQRVQWLSNQRHTRLSQRVKVVVSAADPELPTQFSPDGAEKPSG